MDDRHPHHSTAAVQYPSEVAENASDSDDVESLADTPDDVDRRLLEETEIEEKLVTEHRSPLSKQSTSRHNGQKRRRSKAKGNERLIQRLEGGFRDNSSTDSFELSEQYRSEQDLPCRSYIRYVTSAIFIAALFMVLGFASQRASRPSNHSFSKAVFHNGTHSFAKTTIIVSLDGFRADFLYRNLTPSLNAFAASGISPKYMLPSFPSVTFANHYTLVTGLYPESHGIVGNQFWDPDIGEEFYYTNVSNSMQPKWWSSAEPVWVKAERSGIKTAVHMWPGSEAHIGGCEPTYLDEFNAYEPLDLKVHRILQWLDMEEDERPQLIAAYVPNVDADGHMYGPNSTEIRKTIVEADNMFTLLIEGLLQRNLTEIINLVVVSDHGMATVSNERVVQLDDIIDMNRIDHMDGWPLRGLRTKNPMTDVPILYEQLLKASASSEAFDVYTLETMPERYHFTNNPRIAPLWVVPKAGWIVVEREDFDIQKAAVTGQQFHPIGLHGYDHEHPLMRAIFIARGPAFPHEPNSRAPVFQNVEVYNIICDSLEIEPLANNGTIRLPFQTEGLHTDSDDDLETPSDPDLSTAKQQIATTGLDSRLSSVLAQSTTFALAQDTESPSVQNTPTKTESTAVGASSTSSAVPDDQSGSAQKSSWWKYLHDQLQKAKDWAKEFIESVKENEPNSDSRIKTG